MTAEQAALMIGALDLREKVIARLATWEGMRPGEILALQVGDLDTDSVWVRCRVYKGDIDDPNQALKPAGRAHGWNSGAARRMEVAIHGSAVRNVAFRVGEWNAAEA